MRMVVTAVKPGCRLHSSHNWWPHPATARRTPLTTITIHSGDQRKPPFCYIIEQNNDGEAPASKGCKLASYLSRYGAP